MVLPLQSPRREVERRRVQSHIIHRPAAAQLGSPHHQRPDSAARNMRLGVHPAERARPAWGRRPSMDGGVVDFEHTLHGDSARTGSQTQRDNPSILVDRLRRGAVIKPPPIHSTRVLPDVQVVEMRTPTAHWQADAEMGPWQDSRPPTPLSPTQMTSQGLRVSIHAAREAARLRAIADVHNAVVERPRELRRALIETATSPRSHSSQRMPRPSRLPSQQSKSQWKLRARRHGRELF